ncbi:hypothetical protein COLO4_15620 [Corchorus olitorius]|uniref:RNase H type-1 domain-containing protein n=1 Tax=Corchorus olitorius TaxID=93759 RepID=A0A1R3JM61_9ROSI|nr:hypothetical protein COLO4_15620 [Corchorus olitorius]
MGAFGVLAGDNNGEVLGAYVGKLDIAIDAFTVECRAALKAIKWARDMAYGVQQNFHGG